MTVQLQWKPYSIHNNDYVWNKDWNNFDWWSKEIIPLKMYNLQFVYLNRRCRQFGNIKNIKMPMAQKVNKNPFSSWQKTMITKIIGLWILFKIMFKICGGHIFRNWIYVIRFRDQINILNLGTLFAAIDYFTLSEPSRTSRNIFKRKKDCRRN